MLKSKFSFIQYYLIFACFNVFFFAPAVYLLSDPFHNTVNHGIPVPQAVPGLLLLLFYVLFLQFVLRKIPRVTISTDGLLFRAPGMNKSISWNEIGAIDVLTTDYHRNFLFFMTQTDATIITTKTGEKASILANYYLNMRAMRIVLSRAQALLAKGKNIGANLDFDIPAIQDNSAQEPGESTVKYSNSFLLSGTGITFILLMIGVIITAVQPSERNAREVIALALFTTVVYFSFSAQAYYFRVSDTHLFIRNHLFPWYRKVYAINEIAEVTIATANRRTNALQIITKDFQSNAWCACSLHDKTWDELVATLTKGGSPEA